MSIGFISISILERGKGIKSAVKNYKEEKKREKETKSEKARWWREETIIY